MEEKNQNQRIVIVGDIESSNNKQTKVRYEAIGGERICYIPRQAIISTTKTSDGKTAFMIESCDLRHGRYDVNEKFADVRAPHIVEAEHIEAVELLEHGGDGASEILNKPIQPQPRDLFSTARRNENDNRKHKIDTSINPLNVTSDGLVILPAGITIDFMTATCQSPIGYTVNPIMMFYSDTMNHTDKPVCATCGCEIPENRPVFLMSDGSHLYPCAEEQEWVWWTVSHREVKTLKGEE